MSRTLVVRSGMLLVAGLAAVAGILVAMSGARIEDWIGDNEARFMARFSPEKLEEHLWLLIPTAFAGGLIASLSPCILALLPVNLSYIGALQATSRYQAFKNALMFMGGVVLVLSLFGLVSAFAGAVIVDYKGYIHLGVGLMSLLLGLGLAGLFKIRVPGGITELPTGAGPFLVGVCFALVTSPCASPVLLAMLLIAGSSGQFLLSVGTMVSYAVGYTMLVFVCSLMTGLLVQVNRLKQYSREIHLLAGAILVLAGLYYTYAGAAWLADAG